MKVLKWLDRHFEEVLMSALLIVLVIVMTLQVVLRYVFKSPLSFPEELCRYLFIWISFIGMSYSIRCNNSLKIDVLETIFPKLKPFIQAFGTVVFILFLIIMIWKGSGDMLLTITRGQVSPALGIPMWTVYISFLVGCVLSFLRILQQGINILLLKKQGNKVNEGGGN